VSPDQVIQSFAHVRRAQNDGRYAPHKPLLLLLALARVQRGEPRLAPFTQMEPTLKTLLAEFGPTNSERRAHLPFWHLKSDDGGALWQVRGPAELLRRPAGTAPGVLELRGDAVQGGFTSEVHEALTNSPKLLQQAASAVLQAFFPESLHEDIAAEIGLSLEPVDGDGGEAADQIQRRRDPAFRERVLLAYEYRCCVCGFDLRVGHRPAGLEAAHIKWRTFGGPDVEPNGLCLCALHHKLFDLGAFTVLPGELRIVFSQKAVSPKNDANSVLAHHGRKLLRPQSASMLPAEGFLNWNMESVFKKPHRELR
jgi:putative restriction endonuclease